MSFFKMSNNLFDLKLSPKAVFVYAYLSSKVNCLQHTIVKYAKIAKSCNMDIKTVRSAVAELENAKLVNKHNRYNTTGYIANGYYVTNLIKDNKGWFKVDRSIFKTSIKATDFVIYSFINKCMSSDKLESFPSLTAIHKATGISRSRVAKAVTYLRTFTFINRVKRKYKRTQAFRHNRYMQFKCNLAKRKAHANIAVERALIYNPLPLLYTKSEQNASESFVFSRWCRNSQTVIRRTNLFTIKKE
jgi:DNA-binding transcriptional regulator GbsR (MarR family)